MPSKARSTANIVTLKEVAVALGVSTMTVSRAINNRPNVDPKTKQDILEVAQKMGYTPNHVAKSLVSSRTYTIGVVIPEISHSFFPDVVHGIEEATKDRTYQIFLTNTSESFDTERKAIDALRSKRVDGILISTSLTNQDTSYYRLIVKSGLPIVFFDRCVYDIGASCIGVNDRVASRQITEHLIGLHGHAKIGFISGSKQVSIAKDRYDGFVDAMTSNGRVIDPTCVIEHGFNEKSGFEAMNMLLALPAEQRPRAVVAVNDPVAIGAMDAIKNAGLRVPDDIAIVGFTNDIRAELMYSPLTTVHQPANEIGQEAAAKLIRTIENKDEPVEHLVLDAKLVIRKSCGC